MSYGRDKDHEIFHLDDQGYPPEKIGLSIFYPRHAAFPLTPSNLGLSPGHLTRKSLFIPESYQHHFIFAIADLILLVFS
jgi:hypothetical protein